MSNIEITGKAEKMAQPVKKGSIPSNIEVHEPSMPYEEDLEKYVTPVPAAAVNPPKPGPLPASHSAQKKTVQKPTYVPPVRRKPMNFFGKTALAGVLLAAIMMGVLHLLSMEDAPSVSNTAAKVPSDSSTAPEAEAMQEGEETVAYFDPFAGLDVWFEGTAQDSTVHLSVPKELSAIDYAIDDDGSLRNGSTITIRVPDESDEWYLQEFHALPKPREKEYAVSGLSEEPALLTSLDEIQDPSQYQELAGEVEQVLSDFEQKNWYYTECMEQIWVTEGERSLNALYLLNLRDGAVSDVKNALAFVFEQPVTIDGWNDTDSRQISFSKYNVVYLKNVTVCADGTLQADPATVEVELGQSMVDLGISFYGTPLKVSFYGRTDLSSFEYDTNRYDTKYFWTRRDV